MEKRQIQTPSILKEVRGAATMMARARFNSDKKTIVHPTKDACKQY
jgi:hypothetical protein